MNPYAKYLGEHDPHLIIRSTAGRLRAAFAAMGAARAEAPWSPGKWSPRQVLCHLADTEIAFAFRLRQALAEPHHVIQPFDQDAWIRNAPAYDVASALNVFESLREWNTRLVAQVPPETYSKPLTHPERGTMTFRTLVETMAGHDLNHLAQIESV
ncbi:MAG: DinB family protein [Bryobacteraceae bacterium]|nr:DinB family protein [Bryobacteraceae bacterium]